MGNAIMLAMSPTPCVTLLAMVSPSRMAGGVIRDGLERVLTALMRLRTVPAVGLRGGFPKQQICDKTPNASRQGEVRHLPSR